VEAIRRRVEFIHPQCPIAEVMFPLARLTNSAGVTAELDLLSVGSIVAFCGIGNPAAFQSSLEKRGWRIADFRSFPDHHNYTRLDIEELEHWARTLPVDAVLCTQKDLVKISLDRLGDRPLWALEIGTHVSAGAEALKARLEDALKRVVTAPSSA
jgi:tetraacyldisaccharide 4'-kinase